MKALVLSSLAALLTATPQSPRPRLATSWSTASAWDPPSSSGWTAPRAAGSPTAATGSTFDRAYQGLRRRPTARPHGENCPRQRRKSLSSAACLYGPGELLR